MRAWLALRNAEHYRKAVFAEGLKRVGYQVMDGLTRNPERGDILVVWNRYGAFNDAAKAFEHAGLPVVVAENGYFGNDFAGKRWYAISLTHHNGAGTFVTGGPERWDSLGVDVRQWRTGGSEIVLLPQRGIGPQGVAMPMQWAAKTKAWITRHTDMRVRVREHPGRRTDIPDIEHDLKHAAAVCVWGSGAGMKAMLWGIPVYHSFPRWIGAPGSRPLDEFDKGPLTDDRARLDTFRRAVWAMWTIEEIAAGEPFSRLLSRHV